VTYVRHKTALGLIRVVGSFFRFLNPFSEHPDVEGQYEQPDQESNANCDVIRPKGRKCQNGRKSKQCHCLACVQVPTPIPKPVAKRNEEVDTDNYCSCFSHIHQAICCNRVVCHHREVTTGNRDSAPGSYSRREKNTKQKKRNRNRENRSLIAITCGIAQRAPRKVDHYDKCDQDPDQGLFTLRSPSLLALDIRRSTRE
jgi:hypothetical protein